MESRLLARMVILIFKDVSYFNYNTEVCDLTSVAAFLWIQIMEVISLHTKRRPTHNSPKSIA